MTKRSVFTLSGWLLVSHITASAFPLQQCVRGYPYFPCRSSLAVRATKSQVASIVPTSVTTRQLFASPTIVKNTAEKRCDINESMMKQRAWIYSTLLPGCGQVYNAHYWKLPVIYLGFVGLGWGTFYYHKEYMKAKQRLILKQKGASLEGYVGECRQDRDLCIILTALWYVVNILDAYVGASLKTFTLSDDISMEIQPGALSTMQKEPQIGLHLTLSVGK